MLPAVSTTRRERRYNDRGATQAVPACISQTQPPRRVPQCAPGQMLTFAAGSLRHAWCTSHDAVRLDLAVSGALY